MVRGEWQAYEKPVYKADVRGPHLVGTIDPQTPQQVRVHPMLRAARHAQAWLGIQRLQAHQPQQATHPVVTDPKPVPPQSRRHPLDGQRFTSCPTPPYHRHTTLSTGPEKREYCIGDQAVCQELVQNGARPICEAPRKGLTSATTCQTMNYEMRPAGLEPATFGFEVRDSIQLSYGRSDRGGRTIPARGVAVNPFRRRLVGWRVRASGRLPGNKEAFF